MKKKQPKDTKAHDQLPHRETIAGLEISPETDIPFGKPLQMGLYEYMIYERATEDGYTAGIATHLGFMRDHPGASPAMLDDKGFTLMLDAFMPIDLGEHDRAMWRAHFIAGWASVFLGLVREVGGGRRDDGTEEPPG